MLTQISLKIVRIKIWIMPDLFYNDGSDNYRNIGKLKEIRVPAQDDKIILDGKKVNMRDYQNNLYVMTGGKRVRLKSKRRYTPFLI